ncbi:DsbA family protein [Chondromyces apiculatus]|uniref:DsbA oxidoreductase n=1 Tax=Chondromyces apiculatus DSM 436 TaxID=1192034 RepID=A0A017T0W6_9BACT|nr:thioredoxin domain-containing protein [Chondromyces apiculatus]EYF02196.1 DsbA oxidoreductase [Chondromyces apiculatus DSM 436]
MPRRAATFLVTWLALLVALTASCAPGSTSAPQHPNPAPVQEVAVSATVATDPAGEEAEMPAVALDLGPVPVTPADPVRGRWDAPVTLVVFSDLECPYCKRLDVTLNELRRLYGPNQLRVVWKNNPLPFHPNARPAAETAMALFAHRGADVFWAFQDAIFSSSKRPTPEVQEEALRQVGATPEQLNVLLESGAAKRKVSEDMELARQLRATGTPASFINGVFLSGAQPPDKFQEIIDAQLLAAKALREQGVPARDLYTTLVRKNYVAAAPPPPAPEEPEEDLTLYRAPVGTSPVKGKSTALVTMVIFSDFQCPFCARVDPTVHDLLARYGDDLRVVWKNAPLPFHPRAEPAAQLALEARAQKGDTAFWEASAQLFANQKNLDDDALLAIATTLKLNVPAVKRAIETHKHKASIEADQELADDLRATGTPHFFINGRRLVGAHPTDKFQEVIDAQLAKARALVAQGTPPAKVYDVVQKDATAATALTTVTIPAPGKANPSKGAPNARVVVQVFSDFQCPFCARVLPTLDELVKAFPGQVRIVWRNRPLPFHKEAPLASEAAMEAYAQKGAKGFWAMHDLLFQNQRAENLNRAALEQHAATLKLDLAKFATALDTGAHRGAVQADIQIADDAKLMGTPNFVINGYVVSGAQPLAHFKRVVKRALADAQKTK